MTLPILPIHGSHLLPRSIGNLSVESILPIVQDFFQSSEFILCVVCKVPREGFREKCHYQPIKYSRFAIEADTQGVSNLYPSRDLCQ